MLEYNPYFRPSAEMLLKNPIFDKIRIPALERSAQCKIFLKFDSFLKENHDTP